MSVSPFSSSLSHPCSPLPLDVLATSNRSILPDLSDPVRFRTFPDPRISSNSQFRFIATSCITPNFPYNGPLHRSTISGFDLLAHYLQHPSNSITDFMIFLGDFIYADIPVYFGDYQETYRRFYRRNYQSPSFKKVYQQLRMSSPLFLTSSNPSLQPSSMPMMTTSLSTTMAATLKTSLHSKTLQTLTTSMPATPITTLPFQPNTFTTFNTVTSPSSSWTPVATVHHLLINPPPCSVTSSLPLSTNGFTKSTTPLPSNSSFPPSLSPFSGHMTLKSTLGRPIPKRKPPFSPLSTLSPTFSSSRVIATSLPRSSFPLPTPTTTSSEKSLPARSICFTSPLSTPCVSRAMLALPEMVQT